MPTVLFRRQEFQEQRLLSRVYPNIVEDDKGSSPDQLTSDGSQLFVERILRSVSEVMSASNSDTRRTATSDTLASVHEIIRTESKSAR